ncbi:hypothetical protein DPMN_035668 [Dreissena polymorpha]|uniref:Uncharacterized protein n=1 Tax=Dreissena polymorpha TaxID=45954 RepID=A0A9D4M7Q7_DREPO|nr:hypothetical protein DPMN_035668 [Dreissena polymorpha]
MTPGRKLEVANGWMNLRKRIITGQDVDLNGLNAGSRSTSDHMALLCQMPLRHQQVATIVLSRHRTRSPLSSSSRRQYAPKRSRQSSRRCFSRRPRSQRSQTISRHRRDQGRRQSSRRHSCGKSSPRLTRVKLDRQIR